MKANRKFLQGARDDAVSPVIAVILMVAITVVLAATVYVWVSGFSASSSTPSKSLSLSSGGTITSNATSPGGAQWKNYTISAATPGMKYKDFKVSLDGTVLDCAANTGSADTFRIWSGGSVQACSGSQLGPDTAITAGAYLEIYDDGAGAVGNATLSGKTLRLIDSAANSILAEIPIG